MKHYKTLLLLAALLLLAQPMARAQEVGNIAEAVDSNRTGWVASVLHWYDAHMNYMAVGGLMTLESSFIPFPLRGGHPTGGLCGRQP